MLKRAAESRDDFKIIMFNHEDVNRRYAAKPTKNEYFVFVQVGKGDSYIFPGVACEPEPANATFSPMWRPLSLTKPSPQPENDISSIGTEASGKCRG